MKLQNFRDGIARKPSFFKQRLFVAGTLAAAVILILAIVYLWLEHQVQAPASAGQAPAQQIVVTDGMRVSRIADTLAQQKVIASSLAFKYYVWKTGKKNEFKAGTYTVSRSQNIQEIVTVMAGELAGEVQVTIVEGWTAEEIGRVLSEALGAASEQSLAQREERQDQFQAALQEQYDFDFWNGLPATQQLEGYLFPDTYRFFRDSAMTDVVQKMLQNFDRKLTAERRGAITQAGWTLNQVIILASIVQKEVPEAEMPKVAGIFITRLRDGQRLESDATVNYVTGKGERQPSVADTQIDSPYNTYRHDGLPPGPICNPGLAAIDAVITPEFTDYRYFLSAQEGKTVYSQTYQEHLEQKRQYLDQSDSD